MICSHGYILPRCPYRQCGGKIKQDWLTSEYFDLYLVLRKAKRIGILLSERNAYFVSDTPVDPWGGAVRIGLLALMNLIDRLTRDMDLYLRIPI